MSKVQIAARKNGIFDLSLSQAIATAQVALIQLQNKSGYWLFESESDCLMSADYILFSHFVGNIDEVLQCRLANYMRKRQAEDGSFPLFYGGPGDVSLTTKVYYALKLSGDSASSPHMKKSRNFILSNGGVAACNVYTRFSLAEFEQIPWRTIPYIPVEMILLPNWSPFHIYKISYWVRVLLVPLSILYTLKVTAKNPKKIGVSELLMKTSEQGNHYFSKPFSLMGTVYLLLGRLGLAVDFLIPNKLRQHAIAKAFQWIQERLNGDDGLGGMFPAMLFSYKAMSVLEIPENAIDFTRAKKAIQKLLISNNDEACFQPCLSPTWDTGFATLALQECRSEQVQPAINKSLNWLLSKQLGDVPGDWRIQCPDFKGGGGWAFQFNNAYYPDVDDTAMIAFALYQANNKQFDAAIDKAARWVEVMQSKNRGFGAFDIDNMNFYLNDLPFLDNLPTLDAPSADVSARGVMFLATITYDKSGAPIWYLGAGEQRDSQWTIPLQRFQWNPAEKKATPTNVGSITLTFSNASAASMSWQIAEQQKEENIEPYLLSGTQATDDHTGTWFDATEPGYGLTMSNQGAYDIAVVYFYDDNGNPIWALGDNGGEKSANLQLFSYKSTCPDCENLQTQGSPAGNISYSFNSENEAIFNAAIEQSGQLSFTWLKTNKSLSLLSNPASGRPHPAALAQFISDDALEQFIKEGMKARGQPSNLSTVDFSPAPTQPIPGDGAFSTTNIQVAGVDEADLVKTDGQYMYLADPSNQNIRIVEMQEQPAKITEKALIELDQTNPLNGMYLLTDRSAGDDLLVTIHGGAISAVWELSFIWDTPWPWVGGETNIKFYNVSQPGQPKQLTSLTLDGVLITSRRIGETLYVVTRFSPDESQPIASDSPEGIPGNQQVDSVQQREASIDNLTLDELLPTFSIDSSEAGTSEQLVTANSTFLPPIPDGYRGTDIITVSKIDLKNPDATPQSVSIVGQSEAVYVSQQALYLSTSKYNYLITPFESSSSDDTTQQTPSIPISQRTTTQIHKISLTENAPVYSGSATIEGYLDGTADQKPFRFSEHEGVLRVVSSGDWKSLGQHRVTLLRESNNSLMEEVSHLPNKTNPAPLGKPGENLYATRFLGTRLFMVTFLQTDPLIVVDLANPSDPKLKGELEIPGYSDYLHPIGENLLLGFAKMLFRQLMDLSVMIAVHGIKEFASVYLIFQGKVDHNSLIM